MSISLFGMLSHENRSRKEDSGFLNFLLSLLIPFPTQDRDKIGFQNSGASKSTFLPGKALILCTQQLPRILNSSGGYDFPRKIA